MATRSPHSGHAGVRRCILAALAQPLALQQLPPAELDFTLRVMRRARLLARLAARLRAADALSNLATPVYDSLVGALAITDANARSARWEMSCIERAIERALASHESLVPIAMKGCAYLLAGTPNAPGRLFADVDLLLAEEHLPIVERQLTDAGWRVAALTPYDDNYYRIWTHELPPMKHPEREVEIDLHHNVVMRTARVHPDARLLLASARRIPGSRFGVLSPVDMTLHAMVHLFHGDMQDSLRELVDIDDLLRHYGEREPHFWDELWPRAVQLDLTRAAFYGLHFAHRVLGTPIPSPVITAARRAAPVAPLLWLMNRLVPRALFPQHPDRPSMFTSAARWLLYMRSHWIRMPPVMLVRHLSYKFYVKHLRRQPDGRAVTDT